MKNKKITIVGAGPAGATCARLLADAGYKVDLYDKRNHVGGNCYDQYDPHGVLIHPYGPHYFRTDSYELLSWLSQFTQWITANYLVRAEVDGKLVPLPISLSTITNLTGKVHNEDDLNNYLAAQVEHYARPSNAREQCLTTVGHELYEKIFKNYTRKQWGIGAENLDPSITARIPLRYNFDERYPQEKFQVLPLNGYTYMFERMLDHPQIEIHLNNFLSADDLKGLKNSSDLMIYSGMIDHFYDQRFGPLGYRSLRFEWKNFPMHYWGPCVQINYPNDHQYSRTVEIKHITGQRCPSTTVCFEYPAAEGEGFYPLLTAENADRYQAYLNLAKSDTNSDRPVYFIGRLAEFRYYNMDHVFIKANELAEKIIGHRPQ
ncbi:MAG: UDP-galactopyranose mutase [Pseudomonadota bacterium]